jgi:glutamate dehydrogenase/leucine dehydrogenase
MVRVGRLQRTPGGILVPASAGDITDMLSPEFNEALRKLAPAGMPDHIRQRGMLDLLKALAGFNELLPPKTSEGLIKLPRASESPSSRLTSEELIKLVKRTNAFDEHRIKNNHAVTVVFDGKVHPAYVEKKVGETLPLLIAYTHKGDIKDKKILDGMLDEGIRLAEAMNSKNRIWDTQWDGGKTVVASEGRAYRAVTAVYGDEEVEDYVLGKGGVRFTRIAEGQENQNEDHKRAVIEDWVASSITAGMLGRTYIAGPDMNMSKAEMKWIVDKAFAVARELGPARLMELGIEQFPLATTSRDTEEGGFDHFKWSVTSRGVVEGMLAIIRHEAVRQRLGLSKEPISVIIQGFGDVGSGIAKILLEECQKYNIRIVGVSDRHGAIYNKDGLDAAQLLAIRKQLERAEHEGTNKDAIRVADLYRGEARRWGDKEVDQLLEQEATILMPAAGPNAITAENVGRLKVKMIIEGANNAIKRGLEKRLHNNGILYFRGELMNGGGVYTSTDEFFHYMMEGEGLRRHVEEYRTHVLDGITDLAISNVLMVLDRWGCDDRRTVSDVVYELAGEMNQRRSKYLRLLSTPDAELGLKDRQIKHDLMERAEDDVARSGGKLPKKIALIIAASERAREDVAYERVDTLQLFGLMDSPHAGLDRQRDAVYVLGKMRDKAATELDQRLEDDHVLVKKLFYILEGGEYPPEVRKNAIEALGNVFGWVAHRDQFSDRAAEILKRRLDSGDERERVWSKWALEKMGYPPAAA